MKDFVLYSDTDSMFIPIEQVIEHHAGLDVWNTFDDEKKLEYCKRIATAIIKYTNKRCYDEIQCIDYNSIESKFKLNYKQELIAKSGIFIAKKKYSLWIVDNEGISVNKNKTKGLEIIQSSTPSGIKDKLEDIIWDILMKKPDDELKSKITKYQTEMYMLSPEEIAINVGINSIAKYSDKNGDPIKSCPYAVKGALYYQKLTKSLGLEKVLPVIVSGQKTKVVYTIPTPEFNYSVLSFYSWPDAFTKNNVKIDYDLMIEKNFIHKIKTLLIPINKTHLLD